MESLGNCRFRCPACGAIVRLRTDTAPEHWYRNESTDSSPLYPFCETCNVDMYTSGCGPDFHGETYFVDIAFYCPPDGEHVIGAYFRLIAKEEYEEAERGARQNLIDLAVESVVFDFPSAADNAKLLSLAADGTIVADISSLTSEEKEKVRQSCAYYERAGLLRNLIVTETSISFLPDPEISAAMAAAGSLTKSKLNQ